MGNGPAACHYVHAVAIRRGFCLLDETTCGLLYSDDARFRLGAMPKEVDAPKAWDNWVGRGI
jgi:hypothetical protein